MQEITYEEIAGLFDSHPLEDGYQEVVTNDPARILNIVHSIPQVAKHFHRSPATIKDWLQQGAPRMPRGTRFAYDLDAIEAWKEQRPRDPETKQGRGTSTSSGGAVPDPLLDERKRLQVEQEKTRLEMQRRKLEALSGETVSKEDVFRFYAQFFVHIRTRILGVPQRLKPTLPRESADVIEQAMIDMLESELRGFRLYEVNLKKEMEK